MPKTPRNRCFTMPLVGPLNTSPDLKPKWRASHSKCNGPALTRKVVLLPSCIVPLHESTSECAHGGISRASAPGRSCHAKTLFTAKGKTRLALNERSLRKSCSPSLVTFAVVAWALPAFVTGVRMPTPTQTVHWQLRSESFRNEPSQQTLRNVPELPQDQGT